MGRSGNQDFGNSSRILNLPASTANGQPLVHEQLGAGFNPNLILSNWTPGAPVSNSTAEIPLFSFSVGGPSFQAFTQWEITAGFNVVQNSGASILANFLFYVNGAVAASNESNDNQLGSTPNERAGMAWIRMIALSDTQLAFSILLRLGVGATPDLIDRGNTWDHTGEGVLTIASLSTARTIAGMFASEVANPGIVVTPEFACIKETRPNGSPGSVALPPGSLNRLLYNNAGAIGGATNVEIASNNLNLRIVPSPSVPAAGFITETPKGGAEYAHIPSLLLTPEAGPSHLLSPFLTINHSIHSWIATPGVQPLQTYGTSVSTTGAGNSTTIAPTNIYTRTARVEYTQTTAAVNAVAGVRETIVSCSIGGPAAGVGGFYNRMVGAPAIGLANTASRFFMGIGAATAIPTDVEPSSIQNIVGIGYDSADTNLQLMHRGAGAVTKIDLGANFPVPTVDRSTMYLLLLNATPGLTPVVHYAIWNLGNGAIASGTITTNLPTTATYLARRIWASSGGISSTSGIAAGAGELRV
ncbi:MAG: hypothetical protein ACRC62_29555, partial [Microcoleus sp.]